MQYLPRKGNGLVYMSLLLAVVFMMYLAHDCMRSASAQYGSITPSGGDTIDVAIEYTPGIFYMYDDTLGGVHYDMMRDIAARHGLTMKFHPVVSLGQSLQLLDGKVVDILIADVPMTAEYRNMYRFLEPIMVDRQVLVQLRDSVSGRGPVRSALDLGGDTVWIVAGSSVESRIRSLGREIGDTIYIVEEGGYGAEQLAMMTAIGEIPRAVISSRIARDIAASYPQLDIVTEISLNQFQSWIAAGSCGALADSLDRWIVAYKNTPAYRDLLSRYK